MAASETFDRTSQRSGEETAKVRPPTENPSYFVWFVLSALLAEVLLISGVIFIAWGLEDAGARPAGIGSGIGLALAGGALMAVTGMAVWVKSTPDPLAELGETSMLEAKRLRVPGLRQ